MYGSASMFAKTSNPGGSVYGGWRHEQIPNVSGQRELARERCSGPW
jgi:hypothetical protein